MSAVVDQQCSSENRVRHEKDGLVSAGKHRQRDLLRQAPQPAPGQWVSVHRECAPTEFYMGTSRLVYGPRRGHITGSVSVSMPALADWNTGVFASAEAMHAHFAQADVLSADSVITYCGGGGCATTDAFELGLLGYTRVAMYDNSLYEWGADPSLPMTDPSSGQDKP